MPHLARAEESPYIKLLREIRKKYRFEPAFAQMFDALYEAIMDLDRRVRGEGEGKP